MIRRCQTNARSHVNYLAIGRRTSFEIRRNLKYVPDVLLSVEAGLSPLPRRFGLSLTHIFEPEGCGPDPSTNPISS